MQDQPRTRRHDPDRRQRIVAAAIDVIAEQGVAGMTWRKVAAQAGVPLGSLTYHFADTDELLRVAFERVAEEGSGPTLARLDAAENREMAIEALVDVIAGNTWSTPRNLLLSYELYAYAARRPALAGIMRAWMDRMRGAIGRHFDPLTTRAIDAMIEGIGIHNSVDLQPLDHRQIDAVIRRIADVGQEGRQ